MGFRFSFPPTLCLLYHVAVNKLVYPIAEIVAVSEYGKEPSESRKRLQTALPFEDIKDSIVSLEPENRDEIGLLLNHEMINQDFNAIEILNNINNITVISEPSTVNTNIIFPTSKEQNIKLAFLPYCDYRDILEFPEGDFLFSHQDIQGSCIRGDFKLPNGIDQNDLSKYKLVFNGHIHKSSIMKNIINVGSISTHSFSDDQENVPKCYIFDTNTLDLTTFKPTCCPLFRKIEIKKNISELYAFIDQLDKNYKYILHIICPFEKKLKKKIKIIP